MTKSQEDQEKPDDNKVEDTSSPAGEVSEGLSDIAADTGADDSESVGADTGDGAGNEPSDDVTATEADVNNAGDGAQQTPQTEELAGSEANSEPETEADAEPESDTAKAVEGSDVQPLVAPLASALATAPLVASGADGGDANTAHEAAQLANEDPGDADLHEEDHDEEHEDEAHRSFSARVLTWLILLLVGAGAALWGAPKVAPHLPNGLGPVKAWLMPGAIESQTQIAALEAELTARLDAIEPGVSAQEVTTAVTVAVTEAEARTEARTNLALKALGDKVEAADGAEIESRIGQLEARIEGLTTQLEALSGLAGATAELSEEKVAELGTFAAAVEGLRAEVRTLAGSQGALSQRIDDVQVTVERKLNEAEAEIVAVQEQAEVVTNAAVARAALTAIETAVAAGEPFDASLADLAANTEGEVPAALSASATSGVAALGTLRSSFADVARAAIQADVKARDTGGVGGRLAAFLEAQVATRSLTPQEGGSTDAILSRAEDALRRDNLAAAVEELAALDGAPKAAIDGWLGKASARLSATSAVADLKAVLAAEN